MFIIIIGISKIINKMTKYITTKDASTILGMSKITLRNWDKSGKTKAHRHPFNNSRVYKLEDIDKVL